MALDLYRSTLSDIVDKNVFLMTKEPSRRPLLLWYSKDIQASKRHRSECDRLWIRIYMYVNYEKLKVGKIKI